MRILKSVVVAVLVLSSSALVPPAGAGADRHHARPRIHSLSSHEGARQGKARLTLRGSGFREARAVLFGHKPGRRLKVVSDRLIKVTTPPHGVGVVVVRVLGPGGRSKQRTAARFRFSQPLRVTTKSLRSAVAGLPYLAALKASGGTGDHRWHGSALPAGLRLSPAGVLSGTPTSAATTQPVHVVLRDALGWRVRRTLHLHVPVAMPRQCRQSACHLLNRNTHTTQIPATRVGVISRDSAGEPTQVLLTGTTPAVGDVLVIAPNAHAPSGLIAVVRGVTPQDDGTTLVDVTRGTPADAYYRGTVKATAPVTTPVTRSAAARPQAIRRMPARRFGKQGSDGDASGRRSSQRSLAAPQATCDGSISSDLHGVNVTPNLTPTIAAIWKHPLFGGGGIYPGFGGLSLYQLDLDGGITVDMGLSMSGAGTCTLDLPDVAATLPAGALGAVLVDIAPTVTVHATGKFDMRTSATFQCGAEYRWSDGHESRLAYCHSSQHPLQVNSASGVDVTLTGDLSMTVSLDDLVGVDGSLTAQLHGGFHPHQHPVAELDGTVAYRLGGCLACFWKHSPARVTLVSGTVFHKTLLTYDATPPAVPNPGPPRITTTAMPAGTVGQPFAAQLQTADNRPGPWSLVSGSLPPGLGLEGDTISGKPEQRGSWAFTVGFTDSEGRTAQARLSITVGGSGGPAGGGAVEDLDYCRANFLDANDDGSSDLVDLPFPITLVTETYQGLYVNNNGFVTFDGPDDRYTPSSVLDETAPMIAPFWADVDTRAPDSALVTYGASPDHKTFCVDWVGVGYFDSHDDKFNSFQLLLTSTSTPGAARVTFNYGHITWETGDASGGRGGIGGSSAVAGLAYGSYDDGTRKMVSLPGSQLTSRLLDGGGNSLISGSANSTTPGRYVYMVG